MRHHAQLRLPFLLLLTLWMWFGDFHRYQPSFHGVDLSALRGAAVDEYFRQPVVVSSVYMALLS